MGTDAAFATLGLAVGAQPNEITRAFRAQSRASHPDHGGDRRRFEAVLAAYRILQSAGLVVRASASGFGNDRAGAEPIGLSPAALRYRNFVRDLDRVASMVVAPVPRPTTIARTTGLSPSAGGIRFAELLDRALSHRAA